MPDHRLVIMDCDYQEAPCSSFVCDQSGHKKYWVANPHSGGTFFYPIFCNKCIEHMMAHLPAELSPDGAALETRLRSEITLEYDKILKEKLAEQEQHIRAEVTGQLIEQFSKPEITEIPVVVEAEEINPDNDVVYRCLDCSEEFATASKLEDHKKTHTETAAPKNKGGRPRKSQ